MWKLYTSSISYLHFACMHSLVFYVFMKWKLCWKGWINMLCRFQKNVLFNVIWNVDNVMAWMDVRNQFSVKKSWSWKKSTIFAFSSAVFTWLLISNYIIDKKEKSEMESDYIQHAICTYWHIMSMHFTNNPHWELSDEHVRSCM